MKPAHILRIGGGLRIEWWNFSMRPTFARLGGGDWMFDFGRLGLVRMKPAR